MTSPAANSNADTTLGADTTMDSANGADTTMGSVSGADSTEITYPDGYPGFGPEVLPAENTYRTRDEAYKAINVEAAAHGYAFITSRSFQTSAGLTTALYMCDRGGRAADPNRVLKRQRAASRRIGCNFSVYVKERRDGTWQLKHRAGPQFSQHNHPPSSDIFAHRVHRALDADQKDSIDVLLQMDLKLKQIVTFLRLKYRKNVISRDVSNYIASARRQRGLPGGGEGGGDSSAGDEGALKHGEEGPNSLVNAQALGRPLAPAPAGAPRTGAVRRQRPSIAFGPGGGGPQTQNQQSLLPPLPPLPPHSGGAPQGRGGLAAPRPAYGHEYAQHGPGPSQHRVHHAAAQEREDLLLEEELREQLGKELSQSAGHDYFAPN